MRGGKWLSTEVKKAFLNVLFFFKFVAVLLTTKPRGLKALVECRLKKKELFLRLP